VCRFSLMGVANGSELLTRKMYVRRTQELNNLSGWKATLSTCMEVGDVLAPLLTGLADRLSRLISWLLVSLIGRGLGLIYKGIRQSMSGARGGETKKSQQHKRRRHVASQEQPGESLFFGFSR
jgi:hypothetical protein